MKLLQRLETLFLYAVFGAILPLLLLLAGWWGSIPLVAEQQIKYFALGGLLLGLILDLFFLKKWVRAAYRLPLAFLGLAYIFYSVGMFGFFMGVPAFNLSMGLVAGFYMGLRLKQQGMAEADAEPFIHRTALFAAGVLALACTASLLIAAADSFLTANINGMFGLAKPLSRQQILWAAGVAGIGLVVTEYYLTKLMARWAYR